MVRSQVIALSLGTTIAVAGGIAAWQGLLPGMSKAKPHTAVEAPLPVKAAPAAPKQAEATVAATPKTAETEPAPAPTPRRAAPAPAAKPQQMATIPTPKQIAPAPKQAPVVPKFDTVRVEPSGDTVVAGHGAPEAKVDLLAGDKIIGQAQAGDSGDFVIVPQTLAPGNYVLALRSHAGDEPMILSHQRITVSVPEKGQKGVVVALSEPGKASVLLADPMAQAKPAAPATTPVPAAPSSSEAKPAKPAPLTPTVAFTTAEASRGGFYTTGTAPPGTHLRIYLNGARIADVTADASGHWSMTIRKGMVPGHYAVRADAIGAAGEVTARAEVPFDMPAVEAAALAPRPESAPEAKAIAGSPAKTPSQAETVAKPASTPVVQAPAQAAPAAPAEAEVKPATMQEVAGTAPLRATPADAIVPEIGTASVERGDSLWRISRKAFGRGIRYTLIYAANESQIRDPRLIYPGQVFVLPHDADR